MYTIDIAYNNKLISNKNLHISCSYFIELSLPWTMLVYYFSLINILNCSSTCLCASNIPTSKLLKCKTKF